MERQAMTVRLIHGDALEMLATLPAASIQTVVTSPPYFGLRRYTDDAREIGQEETPARYAAALVAVFRELRRVLRDDGTAWLNLGDSMAANPGNGRGGGERISGGVPHYSSSDKSSSGIAPKNLLGIPWRAAFALQDDGWYLRSDIIWSKPNPMPESVTDRPTRSHEYLFLLSKKPRYYYDAAAIAEPAIASENRGGAHKVQKLVSAPGALNDGFGERWQPSGTRNRRTVWSIATQPYSGAHFATMPEALVAPCILAGSSAQACEHCGAAWGRLVEREGGNWQDRKAAGAGHADHRSGGIYQGAIHGNGVSHDLGPTLTRDLGFSPRCSCPDNTGSARSTVLDPFAGSGTVLRVAQRFQRNAIGIDLNADYLELQEQRNNGVQIEMDML
jgi:DNA modification methylase